MKYSILFLFILSIQSYGQERLVVHGTVKDTKGQPIAYANIYAINSGRGVSSNAMGEFRLGVDSSIDDSIRISSLGYATKTTSIQSSSEESVQEFVLIKAVSILPEVVVTTGDLSAKDVAYKAYMKIPETIARKQYDCFFREYMMQNDEWKKFLEAHLYITDYKLFRQKEKQEYEIYVDQFRLSDNLLESTIHKTNPYKLLTDLFPINIDKYKYTLERVLVDEKEQNETYVISFTPINPNHKKEYYDGVFYIDKASLSFRRIDLSISKERGSIQRKGLAKIDDKIRSFTMHTTKENVISYFKNGPDETTCFDKIVAQYEVDVFLKNATEPRFNYKLFSEAYFNPMDGDVSSNRNLSDRDDLYEIAKEPSVRRSEKFWKTYNFPVRDALQTEAITILRQDDHPKVD